MVAVLNVVLALFTAISFAGYGSACFLSAYMKREFDRYHLGSQRALVGGLQLCAAIIFADDAQNDPLAHRCSSTLPRCGLASAAVAEAAVSVVLSIRAVSVLHPVGRSVGHEAHFLDSTATVASGISTVSETEQE